MPNELTLLSIAGSDPSGGAGVQADLKTMTTLKVYGAAAITCLTVQNSQGVKKIQALSPDFVEEQIVAVLDDHRVSHIKIGMVGTLEIAERLGRILRSYTGTVIYDPVLSATTGESLLHGELQELKDCLLPNATYITPNTNELGLLGGNRIVSKNDAITCARSLLQNYPEMKGIIVKGGHFNEDSSEISDFFLQQNETLVESKRKRITSENLHGTGCTFASALSSFLCLGNDPQTAFQKSGEYMETIIQKGLEKQVVLENHNGPLLHHLFEVQDLVPYS